MKTLGLIGGMSPFSTSAYYTVINQLICERLGNTYSAKLLLYSLNFNDYLTYQSKGEWENMEAMLTGIAMKLEAAGADCIIICSNTPHIAAVAVRQKIKIPLLHIAEETAKEITKQKINKVGLIGTKITMGNSFFIDSLSNEGIEAITPETDDKELIHSSIINELTKGVFKDNTKKQYLEIIDRLRNKGAQAIIFGCTEISLLLNQSDCDITIFDTTVIHSKAAVDFALSIT